MVLLHSFRNHLSSYCVLDTILSTENSAAKETDKRPRARELAGCGDDKQVNRGEKIHKSEEFRAESEKRVSG